MGPSNVGMGTQLKILLKKNWWLKKRAPKSTFCEFFFPIGAVGLACIYAMIYTLFASAPSWDFSYISTVDHWTSADSYHACKNEWGTEDPSMCVFGIVPDVQKMNDTRLQFIIDGMQDFFNEQASSAPYLMYFDTDAQMEKFYEDHTLRLWAGVVFDPNTENTLKYTIRINSSFVPYSVNGNMFSFSTGYLWSNSGFLTIQTAIETAFMKLRAQDLDVTISDLTFGVEEVPTDISAFMEKYFPIAISSLLSSSFAPVAILFLIELVRERQEKVKETLKIMGMSQSAYWLSWYITVSIILAWVCVAIVVLGKFVYLFTHSNLFILFVFLLAYGISLVSFAFLLSVWVKSTLMAVLIVLLFMMFTQNFVGVISGMSIGIQALASLASPLAFCLGMTQIVHLDLVADGVQFDNMNSEGWNISSCLGMLVFDSFLCTLLAWYFNNLFPGEYGVPKSPLFPFQKSYWISSQQEEDSHAMKDFEDDRIKTDNPFIEKNQSEQAMKVGVSIRNLRKVYGDQSDLDNCTIAVKGLSLDLYIGEIFGFLGMNGAGKTTTINMLTGLFPPTSGEAHVDGLSIKTHTDQIRKRIGVCPQDNILFSLLTGRQHLHLVGILKGVSEQEIDSKVDAMLELVGLEDKANQLVKTYSGGMKRKLHTGMALIGDPKVVILDEPTAGMDSMSRRHFWNTLRGLKENRVIILVSHMMEECDVLSDRIGIMKSGEMVCYGTSTFLKNKLGSGDYLNIVGEDNLKKDAVLDLVQKHIPNSKIVSETPTDLSILLPLGTREKFADLFAEVEQVVADSKNDLGIRGFGVSMTSLEDVFLRITQDDFGTGSSSYESLDSSINRSNGNTTHLDANNDNKKYTDFKVKMQSQKRSMTQPLLPGKDRTPSWKSHLKVLLQMQVLSARRNISTSLALLFVPAFLMLLMLSSGKLSNTTVSTEMDTQKFFFGSFYPLQIPYFGESGISFDPLMKALEHVQPNSKKLYFKEKPSLESFQNYLTTDKSVDHGAHRYGGLILNNMTDYQTNSFDYVLVYNSSEINSLPIMTNLMHGAILKYVTNDTSSLWPIKSNSHPLPAAPQEGEFGSDDDIVTLCLAFQFGFAVVIGLFTRNIVHEKQKRIQFQYSLLGVRSSVYWASHFLFHYCWIVVSFLVVSIVVVSFGKHSLMGTGYGVLFLMTLYFIPALISSNYLLSHIFEDAEQCLKYIVFANLSSASTPFIISAVMSAAAGIDISFIKYMFPLATFGSGVGSITTVYSKHRDYPELQDDDFSSYFTHEFLQPKFIGLTLQTVVFTAGIIIWNRLDNKLLKRPSNPNMVPPPPNEDADVTAERHRLQNLDQCDDLVQVKDTVKDFGFFQAVRNITLGIKENECFALLGPNGAGKTTTISMMTRELAPSSGDVRLLKKSVWDVNKDEHYMDAKIGCCLQFDSLHDYLTGREHLRLYCKLRNDMEDWEVEDIVEEYLEKLNIVIHGNKISKNYSGGTKRKLSVALALMTGNQIIFLDEPSTGMDPSARRSLWKAIEAERKKPGRAVLLTTHALEEAEAVSQRIGIVVKGQLQCLGSSQHLKSKYEDKYFLFVNSKESSVDNINELVKQQFPQAVLLESYGGSGIKYDIGRLDSVSAAFRSMEDNKDKYGISEYSITQTTLEHIFLIFASKQGINPIWNDKPQQYQCQFCDTEMTTKLSYKNGKLSYLTAILCGIGFFVKALQNVEHKCSNCNKTVAIYKRL